MQSLFSICSHYMNREDTLVIIAQIFIELAILYYNYLADYIVQLAEFTYYLVIYLITCLFTYLIMPINIKYR